MPILAIDTSMAACSAAILLPGAPKPFQRFEAMSRGHAEAIFPMIEAVMADAGIAFDALTKIAVTLGPGSFTGVRAGIAAARGLALAARVPVVGATSLEVMALGCVRLAGEGALANGFAVIHDAKRDEVYLQIFNERGEALSDPQVLAVADAAAALPAGLTPIAGSGAPIVAAHAERSGRVLRPLLADLLPAAADLALLARDRTPSDHPPAPLYLRAADAKPQSDKTVARAGS